MYKTVDSFGVLIARIIRGSETAGYLFEDYMNSNKYTITKESAQCMACSGGLWIIINNIKNHIYLDAAGRLRSEGKLKMKDLPVINEKDLIKNFKNTKKVSIEQLPSILKSGYKSWYTNVCNSEHKYINITDVTWRLDTYLAKSICITLGMHNEDFRILYGRCHTYYRDGKYIIDMADENVYNDLVKIVNEFSGDYQLKDFLSYLLSAINNI